MIKTKKELNEMEMETVEETVEAAETAEVAVAEEKVSLWQKTKSFAKKNGKKIGVGLLGAGAVIGTGVAIIKALRGSDDESYPSYDDYGYDTEEAVEVEAVEVGSDE